MSTIQVFPLSNLIRNKSQSSTVIHQGTYRPSNSYSHLNNKLLTNKKQEKMKILIKEMTSEPTKKTRNPELKLLSQQYKFIPK